MARPGSLTNILLINRRYQDAKNMVSDAVWNFLNSITEINHRIMVQKLNQFLKTQETEFPSLRIVVSLAEGRVAYDSKRREANTWKQFLADLIGNNHNTRISVSDALQNGSGVGSESHFDVDLNDNVNMMSFRQGFATRAAQGIISYRLKQNP